MYIERKAEERYEGTEVPTIEDICAILVGICIRAVADGASVRRFRISTTRRRRRGQDEHRAIRVCLNTVPSAGQKHRNRLACCKMEPVKREGRRFRVLFAHARLLRSAQGSENRLCAHVYFRFIRILSSQTADTEADFPTEAA